MKACPHCGDAVSYWRRLATPARICCPTCKGLSKVRTPVKVKLLNLLFQIPLIALLVWLASKNLLVVFWPLCVFSFSVALASQAIGELEPKHEFTLKSLQAVLAELNLSQRFKVVAIALILLAVAAFALRAWHAA